MPLSPPNVQPGAFKPLRKRLQRAVLLSRPKMPGEPARARFQEHHRAASHPALSTVLFAISKRGFVK